MNESTEKLIQKLEQNIISYLTTGNETAYATVDAIKALICNRPVVETVKTKNNIPTVIRTLQEIERMEKQ